ncbi:hypothetical protein Scep_019400 [Stephania cephalantha]|uniref:Uncharacterized protein n=1 Tax=Stephania cephalantha TaxID=152367 RepID=A0AAP0NPT1_9MAGN
MIQILSCHRRSKEGQHAFSSAISYHQKKSSKKQALTSRKQKMNNFFGSEGIP